jgi:Tfp pilus assembly PilM family ATPase
MRGAGSCSDFKISDPPSVVRTLRRSLANRSSAVELIAIGVAIDQVIVDRIESLTLTLACARTHVVLLLV